MPGQQQRSSWPLPCAAAEPTPLSLLPNGPRRLSADRPHRPAPADLFQIVGMKLWLNQTAHVPLEKIRVRPLAAACRMALGSACLARFCSMCGSSAGAARQARAGPSNSCCRAAPQRRGVQPSPPLARWLSPPGRASARPTSCTPRSSARSCSRMVRRPGLAALPLVVPPRLCLYALPPAARLDPWASQPNVASRLCLSAHVVVLTECHSINSYTAPHLRRLPVRLVHPRALPLRHLPRRQHAAVALHHGPRPAPALRPGHR